MLKNGTFASPAIARASSVLPVPGADEQHAARNATAQLLEFLRIAQEVDELGHFFLRFVAARDVGEVDRVVVLVDQPRARFPERECAAFAAPCICLIM